MPNLFYITFFIYLNHKTPPWKAARWSFLCKSDVPLILLWSSNGNHSVFRLRRSSPLFQSAYRKDHHVHIHRFCRKGSIQIGL